MSFQPAGQTTDSLNAPSQCPHETSGVLNGRSVENANTTHSKSNWFYIALIIGGVVGVGVVGAGVTGFFAHQGMLPAALAKLNSLGALGQAGSITMMVGSGTLILGGLVGVIGLTKKNRNTRDSGSRAWHEGVGHSERVTRSHRTNASAKIVSIGSAEEFLNERGIQDRLKEIRYKAGSIDALIIYGTGNVQLNIDPGFVRLNPKKVILVGARIVHEPCSATRLDDCLAGKEEWLSSSLRIAGGKTQAHLSTFVEQLIVSSVEEALEHTPPSRETFKGSYHLVYRVVEH